MLACQELRERPWRLRLVHCLCARKCAGDAGPAYVRGWADLTLSMRRAFGAGACGYVCDCAPATHAEGHVCVCLYVRTCMGCLWMRSMHARLKSCPPCCAAELLLLLPPLLLLPLLFPSPLQLLYFRSCACAAPAMRPLCADPLPLGVPLLHSTHAEPLLSSLTGRPALCWAPHLRGFLVGSTSVRVPKLKHFCPGMPPASTTLLSLESAVHRPGPQTRHGYPDLHTLIGWRTLSSKRDLSLKILYKLSGLRGTPYPSPSQGCAAPDPTISALPLMLIL